MNKFSLDKSKKYLLACSFGPDSMALFHLLKENGYNFECAIVNYHLRKESDSEVEGLKAYCNKNNVKVHVLDVTEKIESNVEARCRSIRYDFFASLYKQFKYDALLVAHHQDDYIETYLLQKQRQNCPNYYGINRESEMMDMKIIRPLLDYSKKDLVAICDENNVPYAIDMTNLENGYARNIIRHEIVEQLNDSSRAKILKEIELENIELSKMKDSIDYNRIHEIDYFLSLGEKAQKYAINELARQLNTKFPISKENVGEIIKVLKSKKPNITSKIKSDLFVLKEYDYFYLIKRLLRPVEYSFKIDQPKVLDTDYFFLDFVKDSQNRNVSESDYPLIIRNIKGNDIYKINDYEVLGSRLMIDWKVPYRFRRIWPVIINKDGKIIYIPRYQSDFVVDEKLNFYVKLK